MPSLRRLAVLAVLALAACGSDSTSGPVDPYAGPPPIGVPIVRSEGTAISGAPGWTWIPFDDAFCTDAPPAGSTAYGSSTTGLAVSWGPETSTDLVVFLQGGGACWDFFTCGGAPDLIPSTALTGPFGPDEFAAHIYAKYPNSWVNRANLPPSLQDATIVFVPYCTGDVHGGDRTTTYASPIAGRTAVTWRHVGHANVLAFLKRLGPTFPIPRKLVVAGSSAGGFGSLANYPAFRWYWPGAGSAYLVDDSGPPLAGDAIPASTRAAWYASWDLGASLGTFCASCASDMSAGLRELERRWPDDRMALLSHLQDATIRGFFGTIDVAKLQLAPMPADQFEAALRSLGTTVMDPATANAKYFFPAGTAHPTLEDPTVVTTPAPGLAAWLELMLSGSGSWASAADP